MLSKKDIEYKRAEKYRDILAQTGVLLAPGSKIINTSKPLCESQAAEYVLAPLMCSFVIWILQQAKKNKIKKLFFLARDGYPIYGMAKRVCEAYDLGIECSYFYCSRYSLRTPMYSENIEEALEYICRSGIDVTLRKIFIRSGFTDEDIADLIQTKGFADYDLEDVISYSELVELRKVLMENDQYLELLKSRSKEKWTLLHDYFEQEGLLAEDHIAIVDSGWVGTTQKSINDIRKRCGCLTDVEGYYFGLFETPKTCDAAKYHSFYFGHRSNLFHKVFFSNCLFETMFCAEQGTTRGYQREGKMVPVLADHTGSAKRAQLLDILFTYADYFVQEYSVEEFGQLDPMRLKKILFKSVKMFMWEPTIGEAEFFGTMRFSDDLLDETQKEVAPVFSDEWIKENHFLNKLLTAYGFRKNYIHESAWYEASAIRNGKHSLYHRCSYSFYKALSYLKKGM